MTDTTNAEGPVVADRKPIGVDLEKDEKYYFCTCGRSQSQPFCDGSHKGSQFSPRKFVAEETGKAYLCACKSTGNAPFCDGTHKKFSADDVGKAGPVVQASEPTA